MCVRLNQAITDLKLKGTLSTAIITFMILHHYDKSYSGHDSRKSRLTMNVTNPPLASEFIGIFRKINEYSLITLAVFKADKT